MHARHAGGRRRSSLGFGATASEFFAGVLREHGIDWVPRDSLARFEGADERVQRVVTESGRELDADLVVLGIGAAPDIMLARSAGLELGETGGIACSQILETLGREHLGGRRRVRVRLGRPRPAAAGRALGARPRPGRRRRPRDPRRLGRRSPRSRTSGPTSPTGATLEYVGPAEEWDQEVVRGSIDDGEFTIFYLQEGRVAGAVTVGRSDDLERARELMVAGEPVDADAI